MGDLQNMLRELHSRITPVPYLDLFAKEIAHTGSLENARFALSRILKEIGLGDQALLGIAYLDHPVDADLSRRKITNVGENVALLLGPPNYAGVPYQEVLDYVLSGILKPKKVRLVDVSFPPDVLASVGAIVPRNEAFPRGDFDLAASISGSRNVPFEEVPLITSSDRLVPTLTAEQLDELLSRFEFLQRLRMVTNQPQAKEIRNFNRLLPPEKLMRLLGRI